MNDKIAQVIEQAISGRIFPGAVIGYLIEGKPMVLPFGHLTYEHGAVKVTTETVYDVASITKSIPTSSLALQLIDQGKLSLDDYAVKYLPELKGQYMDRMRIRHLLTYTAVLQLEKGLGSYAREGAKKISQILFESPLVAPPGEKYVYTNAPAIWMGIIIERVMKQTLNIAAAEQLFEPLHMDRTTFSAEQFDGD
jgi:CubicO group peptidase (beta-lactamase class C family)